MYCFSSAIFLLYIFNSVNCGVLLWSAKQFRLPALKVMTDDDLNTLITYLDNPKVVIFKGDPNKYSAELEHLILDKYTAYVPTEDLSLQENVIDLHSQSLIGMSHLQNEENILYVIVNEDTKRFKRDVEDDDENNVENENDSSTDTPTGPVWYNADGRAMIYSSRPPVLRMNSSNIILGKSIFTTIDSRETYVRLIVIVKNGENKITLRFKFIWTVSGYWTLKSVEIGILTMGNDNEDKYTLGALTALTASRNFSYHCTGEILFTNVTDDIDLVLYDMQAQPDSLNSMFGSAYDCISFMTVPIWSGIFVTLILLVGLAFGLGAMDSIKTMDRFDNAKTKPLTISVGE